MRSVTALLVIALAMQVTGINFSPSGDSTVLPGTGSVAQHTLAWGQGRFFVIKFDIFANAGGSIQPGAVITSAKLTFEGEKNGASEGTVYVSRTPWNEATVAFNNFGPTPGATSPEDFDAGAPVVQLPRSKVNTRISVDVTSAVQAWSNGTPNNGLVVVANGPAPMSNPSFSAVFSRESNHPQNRPVLEVQVAPEYRNFDGNGNNFANPTWGAVDSPLLRQVMASFGNVIVPTSYEDGISVPKTGLPSAREVSNKVGGSVEQRSRGRNPKGHNDLLTYFGQFLDHDIDLTTEGSVTFNIEVPADDPIHTEPIHFARSNVIAGTPAGQPQEHANIITSFIDGSNVYGSDAARATSLRTLQNGLLKTSVGPDGSEYLPFNTDGIDMASLGFVPDNEMFAAGDVRANENAALMAFHTLFLREHNYWANKFQTDNPAWDDETLFQEARRIVMAEMQAITMYEWLPEIIGEQLPSYQTYNPFVNAGIMSVFSTAAYRFGHTLISTVIHRVDNDFEGISQGPLLLRNAFFNPKALDYGVGSLLRGLMIQRHEAVDVLISDDLRQHLFQKVGGGGPRFDLLAFNIQRGRDHGLPDYNTLRQAYGLTAKASFADVSSDPTTVASLTNTYASVNDIDAFIGGLAEDHPGDSKIGELFKRIIRDQFLRLRDGDRFWFENAAVSGFSSSEIDDLRRTKMLDIIIRNTDTSSGAKDRFQSAFRLSNSDKVPNL